MHSITDRSHQRLQCSFEARLDNIVFHGVQKYVMNIQYCLCIVTGIAAAHSCLMLTVFLSTLN
jgi:hypothetical protein